MKIVPSESVTFLRPYSCSYRSDCSKCPNKGTDCLFPHPYKASEEEMRSVPYVTEIWFENGKHIDFDSHNECIIVSFDEIEKSFIEWNQEEDELLDKDERYETVYDWMRDCIDNGLHPCRISDTKEDS